MEIGLCWYYTLAYKLISNITNTLKENIHARFLNLWVPGPLDWFQNIVFTFFGCQSLKIWQRANLDQLGINTCLIFLLILSFCVFLVLDVHAFERLLGPCMDIMKRNIDDYEEQLQKFGVEHDDLR